MSAEIDTRAAEERLRSALEDIREVKDHYPALTAELEDLLGLSTLAVTNTYLRIGREDESPSIEELAEINGCPICASAGFAGEHIKREEVKVTTDEGRPALQVRNARIRLTTILEDGNLLEDCEVDYMPNGPVVLLIDADEEVRGEIAPAVDDSAEKDRKEHNEVL